MKREMSAAPDWMVPHMRQERIKCNAAECNAVPEKWLTEDQGQPIPHGPEVSYGVPFRWSGTRSVAMRACCCGCMHGL